jgi:ABC-type transport system involved in cytochrome c biogenesis permease component
MTALPIVVRELSTAARRPATWGARIGAGFVGLLLGGYVFCVERNSPSSTVGLAIFYTYSVALTGYCLFGGWRLTVDSLSSEKRDGTMGLLFLTDLKGYDVVLGKLAATSLNAVYRLLAFFPLLAIPFMMGGVDYGMFVKLLLASANALFFSLAAGLVASSICLRERSASGLAALIVIGLSFASPAYEIWKGVHRNAPPSGATLICAPWFACYAGVVGKFMGAGGLFGRNRYIASLCITHAYGWACLLAAFWITPRSWRQRDTSRPARSFGDFSRVLVAGPAAARKEWRTRRLDSNPYSWIAMRSRRANLWFWTLLLALAAGWGVGFWRFGASDWLEMPVCVLSGLAFQLCVKLSLARNAAERFVEDRRAGAMELILSTPLTPREIIAGQWAALRLYFGGPVVFMLIAEFLLFWAGLRSASRESSARFWVWLCLANGAATLMDLRALAWVAMSESLVAKTAGQASGVAVSWVMVFPWLVFIGISPFLFAATAAYGKKLEYAPLVLWTGISLAVAALFAELAKRALYGRFRVLVMENAGRPNVWRRLLGLVNPWAARRRRAFAGRTG